MQYIKRIYTIIKNNMKQVEQFIQEHTRNAYNYNSYAPNPTPWLTPDDAREAVEIAREEIYGWLSNHYRDYMHNPTGKKLEAFFGMDMITDLKQAMKDET